MLYWEGCPSLGTIDPAKEQKAEVSLEYNPSKSVVDTWKYIIEVTKYFACDSQKLMG